MLLVREHFTTRPGQASKLARLFKRAFAHVPSARVMTDLVGAYNTVVVEMEVENLAVWEQMIHEYKTHTSPMDPQAAEEMRGYTDMYVTGGREIYEVVE